MIIITSCYTEHMDFPPMKIHIEENKPIWRSEERRVINYLV